MGKLTQEHIDSMILSVETIKMGAKTTVVLVTHINGFELVASSSCVDPADYDQEVGESLALAKILDQIRLLEGYLSQVQASLLQLKGETTTKITFTIMDVVQEFDMPEEWWQQVRALFDHLALAGPHEHDIAARTSKAITWHLPGGPFASDETKKEKQT